MSDESQAVAMATMVAKFDAHMESDKQAFSRIDTTTQQILTAVNNLTNKLDASISRVHERIEEKATEAAKATGEAMAHAQDAHAAINREKVKLLTAVVAWFISVGGLVGLTIGAPK